MATRDRRALLSFKRLVLAHYKKKGRSFPWRETADPYKIMVSEIMLQQTQASRVVDFYNRFLKKFPTVRALARASLSDVYATWAGLGYNRRAKFLRDAAVEIVKSYGGKVPKELVELQKLPGIGPYSAAAIRAFAWNLPGVVLETNIRTAFIHYFFNDRKKISDKELLPLIEAALALVCQARAWHNNNISKKVRDWYSALMDYGAYLKEEGVRAHRQSGSYVRQAKFEGSVRQARGKILRALDTPKTVKELSKIAGTQTGKALAALLRDGLIERAQLRYRLSR